jgi:HEAT repeat protein
MSPETSQEIEQQHWNALEALRDIEDDRTWDSVFALRKMGTPSVLERSLAWCVDPDPFRRSMGVSVLAQFGGDGKQSPEEAHAMIRSMIGTEQDLEVITSLISAVHFQKLADCVPWLLLLADHEAEDVRWRIAWALPINSDPQDPHFEASIQTVMRLSLDPEPRVRDWATFALATQIDEDSPRVRDALLARLIDTDFDTRSEAAIGLAELKDPRGIEPLITQLTSDHVGELHVEAAETYADPRLQPALLALKRWWDINPDLLERAIAACS